MSVAERYRVERKLGKGLDSSTFLAIDIRSGDRCVLKRFECNDFELVPYLLKEAEMLKAMVHPHIPELVDVLTEGKTVYIIREYVEGHTIHSEIAEKEKASDHSVQQLIADVLDVLCSVHQDNIIHGDLTPENLIRRAKDNAICLVDFGMAKKILLSRIEDDQLSGGRLLDHGAYMAPEQKKGRPQMASDLYALGLIAAEALTGEKGHRFRWDQERDTLDWRKYAGRAAFGSKNAQGFVISDELADFIDRLLQQAPANRFVDAGDASRAFHQTVVVCASDLKTSVAVCKDSGREQTNNAYQVDLLERVTQSTTDYEASSHENPQPISWKLVIGFLAASSALILFGLGVRSAQWARHAVTVFVEERTSIRSSPYQEVQPEHLTNLLSDGSIQLHTDAAVAFWAMEAAARAEGVRIHPLSGYVSWADAQEVLEREDLDRIALARRSRHFDYHTGYALDITDLDAADGVDRDHSFMETAAYRWMRGNARGYGFEPSAKESVVEPWHWRYIGDAASLATFEEEK